MAVQEIGQEQTRELIERLARFRNGLERPEQQLLDSIVSRAFERNAPEVPQSRSDGVQTRDAVAELAAKLEAFEQTLPGEQRALLDALLTKGSHDEAEVVGHMYAAWSTSDWVWNYDYYAKLCALQGGIGVTASPYWWNPAYSQFTCWRW